MEATATDGSASATGSDGAVYTGFGGDSSDSSSSDDSGSGATRMVLNAGEMYGLAVVAAGIFTGFTYFL